MEKANCGHIRMFVWVVMTVLFIGVLSGCGGEYAGLSENEGVSGGAVSASSVSGQAVSGSGGYSRYTYCSDWNLYYITNNYSEDAKLIERNLENGLERKIQIDGIHEVCYADNEWVYYTKRTDWKEEDETRYIVGGVWRSPVNKNSLRMDETAEEVVLETKNSLGLVMSVGHTGIDHRGVQCDGRYIVYEGGEWTGTKETGSPEIIPRVYDIQNRKYVWKELFCEGSFCSGIEDIVLWGDSVFLYDYDEDALVRIRLETGDKMVVVPFEDYKLNLDDETNSSISTASKENIFWVSYDRNVQTIWQYRLSDQKRFSLIKEAEIHELLEQRGLLECPLGEENHTFGCAACFSRAGRLYVQVGISGEGKDGETCENVVMLSKELGRPDAALVYEEKLNECLANPEKRQKVFSKEHEGIYGLLPYTEKVYFKSRGICVAMTEDECLMYIENEREKKNMPASYDFHTGKMHFLEKSENWLSRYLYDRNNCMFTGDPGEYMERYELCNRMPNNYDVPEKGE